jgi:methylenetetrahydrofolate reductase (NADPH)
MSATANLSTEHLRTAIAKFLDDYSIETSPHDIDKFESFVKVLKPGTRVYIAHLPGLPLTDVVGSAIRLRDLGFTPVPHIVSRKVESESQIDAALAELAEHDIDHALVIGGDQAVDDNPYDSSLELLETGLFGKYGFRQVGIAGHPEGSKAIGDERARQALAAKAQHASAVPYRIVIVTQFGFDPVPWVDFEKETAAAGIDLPIHVGMAGPASLRQLLRYAVACGVGASARMLMTRSGATANLLRTKAPDDLITYFARHNEETGGERLVGAHFFAFGGVIKTANWANAVLEGRYEFNSKETGFRVSD